MKFALNLLSAFSFVLPLVLCTPAEAKHGWRPAGDLIVGVGSGNAFPLSDGRVVSVGIPDADGDWPAITQIWTPRTKTWTASAATPVLPHIVQATPAMLDDGRILVTGYCESDCHGGSNAEIYDPATDTWTMPGQMKTGRYLHAAVKLLDGRVLVVGGCSKDNCMTETPSAEIFNPATGKFTPAASMRTRRACFKATLLADGRVLVTGGYNIMGVLAENEIYDPASNSWTVNRSMNRPHMFHVATMLRDGRVLVAGGACADERPCDAVEIFDPSTGAWKGAGHLSVPREYAAGAVLQDGTVLIAGGLSCWGNLWRYMETAERFDPALGRLVHAKAMAHQRGDFSMAMLPNGRVLAVGGDAWVNSDPKTPGDAELYIP